MTTRIDIPLPADLAERLDAEHERTGAPKAYLVRRALDRYLPPAEEAEPQAEAKEPARD